MLLKSVTLPSSVATERMKPSVVSSQDLIISYVSMKISFLEPWCSVNQNCLKYNVQSSTHSIRCDLSGAGNFDDDMNGWTPVTNGTQGVWERTVGQDGFKEHTAPSTDGKITNCQYFTNLSF